SLFAYQLQLNSSNAAFASSARVTLTLPAEVTLVSLDNPAMTYDLSSRTVYWNGPISVMPAPQVTVHVNPATRFNTVFAATVLIHDGEGIVSMRTARTKVASTVLWFPFFAR